jgi:hypothetical protein
MRYQEIRPSTRSIDPSVDFFIVLDHMPPVEYTSWQTLNENRNKYFGINTIVDLFDSQGLDYKNYFFIFTVYVNIQDIEGYFYPEYLIDTVINYKKCSPDYKINFAQKQYSVNCAMNKMRDDRLLASCWFSNKKIDGLLHTQSWTSTNSNALAKLDELLQLGNLIDWAHEFGPSIQLLEQKWFTHNNNPIGKHGNFDDNFFNSGIKQIFDNTTFSVVLEPVFWEYASIISEKYVQAVYGGTIPIVSGYKVYDSLNKLGFDTFSDIIDTSSQYERDPVLRIWNMLEKNKNVFAQWQDIISDTQIQNRIVNNLTLLRNPEQLFKNSIIANGEISFRKFLSFKDHMSPWDLDISADVQSIKIKTS